MVDTNPVSLISWLSMLALLLTQGSFKHFKYLFYRGLYSAVITALSSALWFAFVDSALPKGEVEALREQITVVIQLSAGTEKMSRECLQAQCPLSQVLLVLKDQPGCCTRRAAHVTEAKHTCRAKLGVFCEQERSRVERARCLSSARRGSSHNTLRCLPSPCTEQHLRCLVLVVCWGAL